MARERGKEWKHVKVVKTGKNNYLIECNFCDKQFWVGSGNRIRAHLGVENIAGVSKCEKVPDTVIATFMKAEEKKMCEKVEMTRKRALDTEMLVLVLVLVLKDSLRTNSKSWSLSWSLQVRSLSWFWSLTVKSWSWSLSLKPSP
jgi:hypothetical protein